MEAVSLLAHPQRHQLALKLRRNRLLGALTAGQWAELERVILVSSYDKGEVLVCHGDEEMRQIFVLDGILKRVVSSLEGRHMILRFTRASDFETSFSASGYELQMPYSIIAATKVDVAELGVGAWKEFLGRYEDVRAIFERELMKIISAVLGHCIALHLHDAPERLQRFWAQEAILDSVPDKDVAAYLNLTPETVCRLKQKM